MNRPKRTTNGRPSQSESQYINVAPRYAPRVLASGPRRQDSTGLGRPEMLPRHHHFTGTGNGVPHRHKTMTEIGPRQTHSNKLELVDPPLNFRFWIFDLRLRCERATVQSKIQIRNLKSICRSTGASSLLDRFSAPNGCGIAAVAHRIRTEFAQTVAVNHRRYVIPSFL